VELAVDAVSKIPQLRLLQEREVAAEVLGGPAWQRSFDEFAAEDLGVEGIAGPVGCEMQVQVWDPFAEHIHKDALGAGLLLQRGGGQGQRLTEGPRLLSVEILDMGTWRRGSR
jgi:hypothetical protein